MKKVNMTKNEISLLKELYYSDLIDYDTFYNLSCFLDDEEEIYNRTMNVSGEWENLFEKVKDLDDDTDVSLTQEEIDVVVELYDDYLDASEFSHLRDSEEDAKELWDTLTGLYDKLKQV